MSLVAAVHFEIPASELEGPMYVEALQRARDLLLPFHHPDNTYNFMMSKGEGETLHGYISARRDLVASL